MRFKRYSQALAALLLLCPPVFPADGAATPPPGLSASDPRLRVDGLKTMAAAGQPPSPGETALLVDMLDDGARVVHQDPDGKRSPEATTPGKEARALLLAHPAASLAALQVGLVNHRPSIRWRCAEVLGLFPPEQLAEALPSLVGALSEDPDRLVRLAASDALVRIGPPGLPHVLELLQSNSPETQRQAIYIAGRIGDVRVIEPLLTLATMADDANALQARQALLEMGPALVPPLLQLLRGEAPTPVKVRAIRMASQLGSTAAAETLVIMLLTSPNDEIRMAALAGLSAFTGMDSLVHPLMNVLTDLNPQIAGTAAQVMARMSPQALQQLLVYVMDTGRTLQDAGFRAMARLGTRGHPMMVEMMRNGRVPPDLRKAAAGVLKQNGFYQVTEADRIDALLLLGDWGVLTGIGAGMEKRFLELIQDPDPATRAGAMRYFSLSGKDTHVPLLLDALGDRHEWVRSMAWDAVLNAPREVLQDMRPLLGRGLDPRSVQIARLMRHLQYRPRTEIEDLRIAATLGDWPRVSKLGSAALAYFLEMLKDPDPGVRLWATYHLAKFHGFENLRAHNLLGVDPTLYEVLRLGGRDNKNTLDALVTLRDQESVSYLFTGFFAADAATRDACRAALVRIAFAARDLAREGLRAADNKERLAFVALVGDMGTAHLDLLLPHLRDPEIGAAVIRTLGAADYIPADPAAKAVYLFSAKAYDALALENPEARGLMLTAILQREEGYLDMIRALGTARDLTLLPHFLVWLDAPEPELVQAARQAVDLLGTGMLPALRQYAMSANLTHAKQASRLLLDADERPANPEEGLWWLAASQDWPDVIKAGEPMQDLMRKNLLANDPAARILSAATLAAARQVALLDSTRQRQDFFASMNLSLTNSVAEVRAITALLIGQRYTNSVESIPDLLGMLDQDAPLGITYVPVVRFRDRATPGIQAAYALGRLGAPAVPGLLERLAGTPKAAEEDNARLALSLSASAAARAAQLDFLKGKDMELAANAAQSLAARRDPEALDWLVDKATSPDVPFRGQVRELLRVYPKETITPVLVRETKRVYDPARVPEVLALLAQLDDPETVPLLGRFLEEKDLAIRAQALQVLGGIGDAASLRLLLAATRDPLWIVRETAAAQILRIGMPGFPLLLEALENKDLAGEGYALRLLRQVSGVDAGESAAQWRDWRARQGDASPQAPSP